MSDSGELSEPETESAKVSAVNVNRRRSPRIFVEVRWGPPGTGRSSGVHRDYADQCFTINPTAGILNWGAYRGQHVLLIDEFNDKKMRLSTLMDLLDPHVTFMNINDRAGNTGGIIQRHWKHVVIISATHPSSWWTHDEVPRHPHYARCLEEMQTVIDRITQFGRRTQDSILLG